MPAFRYDLFGSWYEHTEKGNEMPRKSVYEAATLGSRLDVLTAMRDVVAKALDSVDLKPADLAPLSRRQMEIIDEIEQIQKGSNEDVIGTAVSTPDEKWNAQ